MAIFGHIVRCDIPCHRVFRYFDSQSYCGGDSFGEGGQQVSVYAVRINRCEYVPILICCICRAITSNWSTVLLPIVQTIAYIALIQFAISIALNLKSIRTLPKSVTERMYSEPRCTCHNPYKRYEKV